MAEPIKFRESDEWKAYAREFIRNGGNAKKASDKAGVTYETATYLRRTNKDFRDWLEEIREEELGDSLQEADARLMEAIRKDKPLSAQQRADIKLLYERNKKIQAAINITNNTYQGSLTTEQVRQLASWELGRKLVEQGKLKVLQGGNN